MVKLGRSSEGCRLDTVPNCTAAKVVYVLSSSKWQPSDRFLLLTLWHAVISKSLPSPWLSQHDVVPDQFLISRFRQRTVNSELSQTLWLSQHVVDSDLSLTSQLRPRAVVSDMSPTPWSADAISRRDALYTSNVAGYAVLHFRCLLVIKFLLDSHWLGHLPIQTTAINLFIYCLFCYYN